MNDEKSATPDIVEGGATSARSLGLGVLAVLTLFGLIALGGIQHYRDRANDEVGKALSEKYGVEVVRLDAFRRPGEPITWRVDGTERECILSTQPDFGGSQPGLDHTVTADQKDPSFGSSRMLLCDTADEPREFYEVGADRDEGNW